MIEFDRSSNYNKQTCVLSVGIIIIYLVNILLHDAKNQIKLV